MTTPSIRAISWSLNRERRRSISAAANNPPVANNDTYSVNEDNTLTDEGIEFTSLPSYLGGETH